jgi:hypothetical protein
VYFGVFLALLVESVALRSFVRDIPRAFAHLLADRALDRVLADEAATGRLVRFFDDFESRLNGPRRLWLGLPLAALGVLFFLSSNHLQYVLDTLLGSDDLATKATISLFNLVALFLPGAAVGYVAGIGVWKSIITSLYVSRFSREFDLAVRPSHPDSAGGLKPLGDLIFSIALILIIASLALSALTIGAGLVGFAVTASYARFALAAVIALTLVAFILPLNSAHARMVAARERHHALLTDITGRIDELERSLQTGVPAMTHAQRQEVMAEIDSLTTLYKRTQRAPTWPFDREIVVKFVTPQLFSLFSLMGIAEPIVGAIQALLRAINAPLP